MRRFIWRSAFSLVLMLSAGHLFSQEIIENPEQPLNPDAGRVLPLEEITRITDDSGEYYFKGLHDLKVGPDGDIFLAAERQLLKFSPDGSFIGNYVKYGQGPGEIQDYFQYAIDSGDIHIFDPRQLKIVHLDSQGEFVEEIKFREPFNSFYGVFEGRFIVLKSIWPPPEERTGKMMEFEQRILQITPEGTIERTSPNFPIPAFVGPGLTEWWIHFKGVLNPRNNTMFIIHTSEYLIEALDLESNRVIRRFRRRYPRVKYKESEASAKSRTGRKTPKRKFENDISRIFHDNGRIWVVTSTTERDKGKLIDLFDDAGRYLDNFYLKITGTLMAVRGDRIYVQEKDEMENVEIAAYRIGLNAPIP